MRALVPVTINSTNLTSNAPTTGDPIAWNIATPYNIGDTVKVTNNSIEEIYEALTSVTGGYSPELDVRRKIPKWIFVKPTNKYTMFDNLSDSYTTGSTSLTVTVTATAAIAGLAVTHLTGVTSVVINAYVTIPTSIWTKTFTPDANIPEESTIYFDIPSTARYITLVFSGGSTFYIGNVTMGYTYYNIGKVQNGAEVNTLNFSSMDRDSYGIVTFIKRRNVTKIQYKVFINADEVNNLQIIKNNLNATTVVWSGLDDSTTHPYFKALLTLGIYREFAFEINNPIGPMLNLEIEEV